MKILDFLSNVKSFLKYSKNYEEICSWYLMNLITYDGYSSPDKSKDIDLLVPSFKQSFTNSVSEFNIKYPDIKVLLVETYRSNALQLIHFRNGASKIRANGMHHYSIAVDCAFEIEGKFSYDEKYKNEHYRYLRKCHTKQGLTLLGDWDIGHVQQIPVIYQNQLRAEVLSGVKEFQRVNNLKVDGIVGNKTITKAKEVFTV